MYRRLLIIAMLLLFGVSTSLLLVASTAREEFPRSPQWVGILDVGVGLALVLTTYSARIKAGRRPGWQQPKNIDAVSAFLVALVFVGMWLFRDRLTWNILLPGLAWRMFILLQFLPVAIEGWRTG